MTTKPSLRALATTAALAAATLTVNAMPAAARPEGPGDQVTTGLDLQLRDCPLRRIERQLVRCDALTGTGSEAPLWVPQH
jgi:hypothetical protein